MLFNYTLSLAYLRLYKRKGVIYCMSSFTPPERVPQGYRPLGPGPQMGWDPSVEGV